MPTAPLIAFDRAYVSSNRAAAAIERLTYDAFCLADRSDLDGAHLALVQAEALAQALVSQVTAARLAVEAALSESRCRSPETTKEPVR